MLDFYNNYLEKYKGRKNLKDWDHQFIKYLHFQIAKLEKQLAECIDGVLDGKL